MLEVEVDFACARPTGEDDCAEAVSSDATGSVEELFLLWHQGGVKDRLMDAATGTTGGSGAGSNSMLASNSGVAGRSHVGVRFRLAEKVNRNLRNTGVEGRELLGAVDRREVSEFIDCLSSSIGGFEGREVVGRDEVEDTGLVVTASENNWL